MQTKEVILFDGFCNLCNRFVMFVIRYDKKKRFLFSPLQSDYSKKILKSNNIREKNELNTVYLVASDHFLDRSGAVLRIVTSFNGLWKLMYLFYAIPRFARDIIYNAIASKRYKVFGIRNTCMIPSDEIKSRFIL